MEHQFPFKNSSKIQNNQFDFLNQPRSSPYISQLMAQTVIPRPNAQHQAQPHNPTPSPLASQRLELLTHNPPTKHTAHQSSILLSSTRSPITPTTHHPGPMSQTSPIQFGSLPPDTPMSQINPVTTSIQPNHRMETHTSHGIFKPKPIFNLSSIAHKTQSISPFPKNPKLVMLDPNCNAAMNEEYNSIMSQHTWDIVPRPPEGVNIICFM